MSFMSVRRRALAAGLSLLALTALEVSVAEAASARVRNACGADAKRLCPREKPNSSEMEYCMEAKANMLSCRCKKALEDDGIAPRGHFKC